MNAKPGPKPKAGERYPSGKLKQDKFQGPHPAQVRRATDFVMAKSKDPWLATTVGWLHLHNKLNARQVSAALHYAEMRGRFHRAQGFKPMSTAAASYEQGFASVSHDSPEQADRALKAIASHSKMLRHVDPKQMILLDRMCICDEQPGSWELPEISSVLDKLSLHFGLTG